MRILSLTSTLEKKLLAKRVAHDGQAQRVAAGIVADVQRRGDPAVLAWTKKFDDAAIRSKDFWISQKEVREAQHYVGAEFLRAIRQAARNIRRVAERQLPQPWSLTVEPGVKISQRVTPIESVGCYIPGGHFSLVSTLLMTAIPAQVAGVPRIVAVCPKPNNELLAAAKHLGLTEIAWIGGAQAVGALAYGTKSIPRVEKIFGPGNKYVTAAKQIVSADCAIDFPAGPTEAIVLAERGNARWIAADLLAQAEHAKDAGSFLVTTSPTLANEVQREVARQLRELPAGAATYSLKVSGAILVAKSIEHACEFVNRFAPEHLSIPTDAGPLLKCIQSSGTIFAGPWGAQPLGDYISGSNHVLPSAGWARRRGGLSAADFVKCVSVQEISRHGFARLADSAETLAEAEGLLAHRNAVRARR
jgi:histidinol dehydrogenase